MKTQERFHIKTLSWSLIIPDVSYFVSYTTKPKKFHEVSILLV
jgi:hypothetical protein